MGNGPRTILLAAPRGYCAGVDRAVQTVEKALDLYGRTAGNLRRLLEALGLQRRPREVTPTVQEYVRHLNEEAAE